MTDPTEPPVRLSPPPKVERGSAPTRGGHGLAYWLTVVAFLILGATAFAVFVFLPGWVPEPDPAGNTSPTVNEPALAETPTRVDGRESTGAPEPERQPERITPPAQPQPPPAPEQTTVTPQPPPRPEPVDPTEAAFHEAMTTGLAALQAGELSAATPAFERALTLRPGSAEATEGLQRVETERQLLAIADHRERAVTHEERELWSEATAEYAAVLKLDPTIRFAQEGHERASARAALDLRLAGHLDHPDRLATDEVLEDARAVLGEAGAIQAPGPRLTGQIERLGELVRIAETPIRATLYSDGKTEVLVFRVGRLGRFERHDLDLRPGRYTVVGSRDGYRDVRRTLEVESGKPTITMTVRCEEKL
jgi:hypothetical protein